MNASQLYQEALRRGLTLHAHGNNSLGVSPTELLERDPEFCELIRAHKLALLAHLREASLRHLARQIFAGEFNGPGTDRPTRGWIIHALLEGTTTPACHRAADLLYRQHKQQNADEINGEQT